MSKEEEWLYTCPVFIFLAKVGMSNISAFLLVLDVDRMERSDFCLVFLSHLKAALSSSLNNVLSNCWLLWDTGPYFVCCFEILMEFSAAGAGAGTSLSSS